MIIHPRHIPLVREAYQPSAAKLEWCRAVVQLYEQSDTPGAVEFNGRLIDQPVYKETKRLLDLMAEN
jgi:citrate lyase subunit beta/citryl-CoA lyase